MATIDVIGNAETPELAANELRKLHDKEAREAIEFAKARMIHTNDKRRKDVTFEAGDKVMIRLHRGYKLPGTQNKKLSAQQTGPFEVVQKLNDGAYRLKLPPRWRIHDVISLEHLLPYPKGQDPFGRQPQEPGPIHVQGDDEEWQSFEVERIIERRIRKVGRNAKSEVEYLIKWKRWSDQYNEWYPRELLMENASDLVLEWEAQNLQQEDNPSQKEQPKRKRGRPRKNTTALLHSSSNHIRSLFSFSSSPKNPPSPYSPSTTDSRIL